MYLLLGPFEIYLVEDYWDSLIVNSLMKLVNKCGT